MLQAKSFWGLAIAGLLAVSVYSQSAPTTSLSGTLTDSSNSVVPGAGIQLTNTATHWLRKTATDAQGRFLFTLVPPGAYELEVTAAGFAPLHQEGIRLDADVPAAL